VGLVEEEHTRLRRQRAGESDSLTLAPRELADARLREVGYLEAFEQLVDLNGASGSETDICENVEVGEEGVLLKQIADPAALRRNVDAGVRVEPDALVERHSAMTRSQ
jgi:hypothetical protein